MKLNNLLLCLMLPGMLSASAQESPFIGSPDFGEEVIVHVYRSKDDAFPFMEFSVRAEENDEQPRIEIREVKGRTTEGGFMIISGVQPAGETGISASETYQISFQRLDNYKIYEKAVMDYLRQLPVPKTRFEDPPEDQRTEIDGGDAETQPAEAAELPVEIGNGVIAHVHRNAEDITPFKEFLLISEEVDGKEVVHLTEVTGMEPGGRFIIINGFETSDSGVHKSKDYDIIPYNLERYDHYEQAVLDFMLRLNEQQFSGEESTIDQNWEEAIAPEPEPEVKPAAGPAPILHISRKERKAREKAAKAPSDRELKKQEEQLEKAKYKSPKYKKIGTRKIRKMSSRMSGQKNKTVCPEFRRP